MRDRHDPHYIEYPSRGEVIVAYVIFAVIGAGFGIPVGVLISRLWAK